MSNKTNKHENQRFENQLRWWTGKYFSAEGAKALASMLLMNVPLTTLDLTRRITTLFDMILKEQKGETHDCVVQLTRLAMKEQEH